jgi:hypothetical protein
VLITLLDDSSESVRYGATWSLGGLGKVATSAVPALLKVSEKDGEEQEVKAGADEALKRIIPDAANRTGVSGYPGLPMSSPNNFDTNSMMPRVRPMMLPQRCQ